MGSFRNDSNNKKPGRITEKIRNKAFGLTNKDNRFLEWIYKKQIHKSKTYKKFVLPTQLEISSRIYREEREKLIRENKNYERAKEIGDRRLTETHPLFYDFDIPENIGTTVNFYDKKIEYKTVLSLASFEDDLGVIDVWASEGINRTLKTAMLNDRPGNDPVRIADLEKAYNTIEFPENFDEIYKTHGLINAMGLPGEAAHKIRENLSETEFWKDKDNRMTLSIGGESIDGYLEVFKTIYYENYYSPQAKLIGPKLDDAALKKAQYVDFVDFELNVSCPNTRTGTAACDKNLSGKYENFEELLLGIRKITGADSPPVYIKLSPDFEDGKILELVRIIQKYKMGVVLGNTQSAERSELSTKTGGLSGPGLNKRMLELVKLVHENYENVPIKACGGISTAYDVLTALNAGADTAQMAYGVIEDPYQSIAMTNLELSSFCKKNDCSSLDDFRSKSYNERTEMINKYSFSQNNW